MSNFSVTIPVEFINKANDHLESLGYGTPNFSIPVFEEEEGLASQAGFHAWADKELQEHIERMIDSEDYPGMIISVSEDRRPNFVEHCEKRQFKIIDPDKRYSDFIDKEKEMESDKKKFKSKTEYNPWPVGVSVGWDEVKGNKQLEKTEKTDRESKSIDN